MAKLWIAIGHPALLVEALQATKAARPNYASAHFIYENHRAWQRVDLAAITAEFDSRTPIDEAKLPHGIFGAPATWNAVARQNAQVNALGISPDDTVLLFTTMTIFANVILNRGARAHRVGFVSRKKYIDFNQIPDARYRATTGGLFARYMMPSLGLYPMLNLRLKKQGSGDGERLRRYPRALYHYFDHLFISDNPGATQLAKLPPNVTQVVFPDIRFLGAATASAEPRIVAFFGTPFLSLRNIAVADYIQHLNTCLDYLRKSYPGAQFIYRPHPAETTEVEQLNLSEFEVQNDRQPAEIFFLRNAAQIRAVYSVSSTVSRNALLLGFPSYALWKVFPFEQRARDYFTSVMGDVPAGFQIESLESPPAEYAMPFDAKTRAEEFRQKLDAFL